MNDVRARVLAQTPLFVDYDVPLEQRLAPLSSDPEDLPRFYAGFRPALPLTGDEMRVAAFGVWDRFLPNAVITDSEFIDGYRRKLINSISALPAVADADLKSAIKAEPSGFGWARTPDEGWAAVGLTSAMEIQPSIILDAIATDPSGIVPRWSLTVFLVDEFRLELVRALLHGSEERKLCAAVHLSWMMDRGMYDGTPIPEEFRLAIESLPGDAAVTVLGFLLAHYLTWSRNEHAAFQLKRGFEIRLSYLADQINRRAPSADDLAKVVSTSAATVDMAAFLQGALTSEQLRAAALAIGSKALLEAFAPIADDKPAYVSTLSLQSYVEMAVRSPLTVAGAFVIFATEQTDGAEGSWSLLVGIE